jgi:hypothetical protein
MHEEPVRDEHSWPSTWSKAKQDFEVRKIFITKLSQWLRKLWWSNVVVTGPQIMMLYMHIYYCVLRGLRAARFCDLRAPTMHPFFASACAVCAPRNFGEMRSPSCALLLLALLFMLVFATCVLSKTKYLASMFPSLQFQHHEGWAKLCDISNTLRITLFQKGPTLRN